MTDINNAHIQGDLTISANTSVDNGTGILYTDFIKETTTSSGVSIVNSDLLVSKIRLLNGSEETLLQLSPGDTFTLLNEGGDVLVQSRGGKGIKINKDTGNIYIDSLQDSVDSNTASIITPGGISIGKSILVQQNITGLDGLHELKNTVSTETVLNITNTSSSGYSSVSFKNNSNLSKLNIGYGNGLVTSPLDGTAYIQSENGSELLFRGDSTDSFKISTNGSLDFYSTVASTSNNTGSLRLLGGLSISNTTDASSSTNGGTITTSGGAAIAKSLHLGSYFNMTTVPPPSNPSGNNKSFYIDSSDSLLKSVDSSSVVTTYQPTNSKGDILTHNGTTQVRLPVGDDDELLVSDPSQTTGLKWVKNTRLKANVKSIHNYYLQGTKKTTFIEDASGAWITRVSPLVDNGPSCNLFHSKAFPGISGTTVHFNSNPDLISGGVLDAIYLPYKGIQIFKNTAEADGEYLASSNKNFNKNLVTLSGTNPLSLQSLFNFTFGAFCFSIECSDYGPAAIFLCCKSDPTLNTGNILRIASSPGDNECRIDLKWPSNSYIQLQKSTNDNDGEYRIIDDFEDDTASITITLNGTSETTVPNTVFNYYENKSFMIKMFSLQDYPTAVFTCSKNSTSIRGNVFSLKSPGKTSGELLSLNWQANSLVKFSKNGANYDGNYTVIFTKLA